jgi:leucyl-tRNA synthetase
VDLYVGGVEHAVSHLLYSRFWHKVLFDLGWLSTNEPFRRLVNQGMILGATFAPKDRRRGSDGKPVLFLPDEVESREGGQGAATWQVRATGEPVEIQWDKMSKSRGNVVNPDDVVRQYGADTLRLYEMFMGPLEHSAPWQTDGVVGIHRFLQRAYRLFFRDGDEETAEPGARGILREVEAGEGNERQRRLLHRTIHEVTDRIDRLAFNTAISALMVFVRDLMDDDAAPRPRDAAEAFALLLAPFAPHMAEELWQALGHSRSLAHEPWPAADDALLEDDTFVLVVQIAGKRRGELRAPKSASNDDLVALAREIPEVSRHLGSTPPRRVIVVPGKLVNFVPG